MKGYGGFVVFQSSWYSKRALWHKMLDWLEQGEVKPCYLTSIPGYPAIGCTGGTMWTNLYIEAFGKIMGVNLWQTLATQNGK